MVIPARPEAPCSSQPRGFTCSGVEIWTLSCPTQKIGHRAGLTSLQALPFFKWIAHNTIAFLTPTLQLENYSYVVLLGKAAVFSSKIILITFSTLTWSHLIFYSTTINFFWNI